MKDNSKWQRIERLSDTGRDVSLGLLVLASLSAFWIEDPDLSIRILKSAVYAYIAVGLLYHGARAVNRKSR